MELLKLLKLSQKTITTILFCLDENKVTSQGTCNVNGVLTIFLNYLWFPQCKTAILNIKGKPENNLIRKSNLMAFNWHNQIINFLILKVLAVLLLCKPESKVVSQKFPLKLDSCKIKNCDPPKMFFFSNRKFKYWKLPWH